MRFNQRSIIYLACAAALSGCASTSSEDAIDLETNATIQVGEYDRLMNRLQDTIKTDEEKGQLAWFATDEYSNASRSLREANSHFDEFKNDPTKMNSSSLFSRGTYRERMEAALDSYDSSYEKSQEIKENTLNQMTKAFDNRQQLLALETSNYFPQTMRRVEEQLKQVVDHSATVTNIEPRRLESLETAQHDLEVRTVKKIYVSDAKAELEKHKVARYNNDAPIIHARAAASIQNVESFIDETPRDIERISLLVEQAQFAIVRAEQITLQVRHLRTLPRENFERYILSQETRLSRINKALEGQDLRNLPLETQSKEIAALVELKSQQNDEKMAEFAMTMSQGTQELTEQNQIFQLKIQENEDEIAALIAKKHQLNEQLIEVQTELANQQTKTEAVLDEESETLLTNNDENSAEQLVEDQIEQADSAEELLTEELAAEEVKASDSTHEQQITDVEAEESKTDIVS
ncbi:hypothetical protein RCJ22_26540 [Vibrio sp. FNV 38]|nr:hypothetical protein [Vibrio sp. FNV 38]